ELPSDRPLRYVDGEVAEGGDGSRATPFNNLVDALADSEGSTLVLAPGTYPAGPAIPTDVHIVGTCAAQTLLTASFEAVVDDGADLRGVGLDGSTAAASWIVRGAARISQSVQ